MIKSYYCIKVGNKEIKTEKEFTDVYLSKLKELKKADKNFIELPFVENERKWVVEMLEDFEPADKASELFKKNLFRFLGGFLNKRLLVAEEEFKSLPENFENSVNEISIEIFKQATDNYKEKIDLITDKNVLQNFINDQIKHCESTSQQWLAKADFSSYHLKGEFIGGQKYLSFLKDRLTELQEKVTYLFKDGKRVTSYYDFAKSQGIKINPTHNFDLLKEHRLELFKKEVKKFEEERVVDKVTTTEFDFYLFYFAWLKKELKVIEQWMSDTYPKGQKKNVPSVSNQIEILKYQQFVSEEITKLEIKINPSKDKSNEEKPLQNFNRFFWAYETYLLNVQSSINTYANFELNMEKYNPNLIDPKTQKRITKEEMALKKSIEYEYLKKHMNDRLGSNLAEIENIIHIAKLEIQKLVFTPNPNAKMFLNSTQRRLDELIDKINSIDRRKVLDTELHLDLDLNLLPAKEFQVWFLNEFKDEVNREEPKQTRFIKKETGATPQNLSEIFDSISRYKFIMNLLVERKYCEPNTYLWKDEGKGNKRLLVAILKFLHTQGYYKKNMRLTNEQIKSIAQNTFGWSISIDTIKKTKTGDFILTFIPLASTVE
jgi:hypothetical protein